MILLFFDNDEIWISLVFRENFTPKLPHKQEVVWANFIKSDWLKKQKKKGRKATCKKLGEEIFFTFMKIMDTRCRTLSKS